jgi:hypothetical protein
MKTWPSDSRSSRRDCSAGSYDQLTNPERRGSAELKLTSAQVHVDRHVPSGSAQALALAVRDVLLGLGVAVLLGHAKVDGVYHVGRLGARSADEKVVGLDVAVDEVLLVDRLDASDL